MLSLSDHLLPGQLAQDLEQSVFLLHAVYAFNLPC